MGMCYHCVKQFGGSSQHITDTYEITEYTDAYIHLYGDVHSSIRHISQNMEQPTDVHHIKQTKM
jgi:hypothetical protein